MPDGEFNLISRYFSRPAPFEYLGVGDDCALFPVQAGMQVAISTDMLIEGRHFLSDSDPRRLGHKALAVNLSDLAAMGAQPLACVLGLSMPAIDKYWLDEFAAGFYQLAQVAGCPLLGGDTTRNKQHIIISVTVCGQVYPGQALRRDAAQPGDDIWVSGYFGAPFIALQLLTNTLPADERLLEAIRTTLECPDPPWQLGVKLAGLAHAAIDISDGLAQDVGHILKASRTGAVIHYPLIPVHPAIRHLPPQQLQKAVLAGGDVYQLCFTANPAQRHRVVQLAHDSGVPVTRIGEVVAQEGLVVLDAAGQSLSLDIQGFDHFAD